MVRCPECGQEFVNTRGLGTHRHHAHGYQGEIRVRPSDWGSPEVMVLSRRLARVELRLEKCRIAHQDLKVAHKDLKVAHKDLNVAYKNLNLAHKNLKVAHKDLKVAHKDLSTKLQGVRKALEPKVKSEPGSG